MKSSPYDAIPPCGFRKMHANAPESLRHRCVCERIPGTPPRPDGPVPIGFPARKWRCYDSAFCGGHESSVPS